jgi:tetratricopeptide (TPR) repeat protein
VSGARNEAGESAGTAAGGAGAPASTEAAGAALELARRGDAAAALEAVDRAIDAAPEAIDGYLAKGRILRLAKGDHGAALRAFRKATECAAAPARRAEALEAYALALEPIGRHREAAAALEDALALLPEGAPGRGELCDLASRAHERSGDDARALARHRDAEPLYRAGGAPAPRADEPAPAEPLDVAAFYAREAELLERTGRMEELFRCYTRIVEAAPDRVLFAQADEKPTSAGRERLKRLLHAINGHILANRDDWVARIVKAGFFVRLGRHRQAEALLRRAIETGHDHFYAHHLLAKVRLKAGRSGAALEALERARPLAPEYLDLERDRAHALEACDRKREALEVYRKIEARWPGRRDLLLRAARLREELGFPEEAYEALERAAALEPGGPSRETREKLASLAMRLGRAREAEVHLDAALALAGGGPFPHGLKLARATAREAAGDLAGALADIEALEAEDRERRGGVYREALARRIALLCRLERGDDAVRAADELSALDGEDERSLVLRGDALRAARRFPESVTSYRLAADRKLAEALLDAGARDLERAEFGKALGQLNESFRRNPASWEVFYFAAAAYARLAQAAPAAKYLEAAARVNRGALALMEKDRDFDAVRASAEVVAVAAAATGAQA